MAEVMLRHQLAAIDGISVASCGTGAVVGAPMEPEALATLAVFGLKDEPPHVARQIDEHLVRSADLVLALTREHRRKVVQLDPSATRRAFTLREFGFVSGHVTAADLADATAQLVWRQSLGNAQPDALNPLRVAVAAVFTVNGVFPLPSPSELDVADPYGQPLEAYVEAAIRMLPAVEAIGEFFANVQAGTVPAAPPAPAPAVSPDPAPGGLE
jgi:protein-tyrosine phosphatase